MSLNPLVKCLRIISQSGYIGFLPFAKIFLLYMDQEIQVFPRIRCDKWNTMYCTMYCTLAYKSLLPLPSSMVVFLYAFLLKEWETHQHFSHYYWWFNHTVMKKKHSSLTAHLFIVICQSLKRLKKNTSSSYHQPVVSDAAARHCCQWEIPDVGDGSSFSALTNHVNRVESLIAGQRCMCLGTGTLCKLVFALSQWSGANSVKAISSHQEALAVIPTTCFPFEMTFQWVYSCTVWFLLAPAV